MRWGEKEPWKVFFGFTQIDAAKGHVFLSLGENSSKNWQKLFGEAGVAR